MIVSGYLISIEIMLIIHYLKEPRSNVKGIYWLLKEKKMQGRIKIEPEDREIGNHNEQIRVIHK
jgi:hypothetical protein